MKVIVKNGLHQFTQEFPVADLLVWDVLDRLHLPRDHREIRFEMVDQDAPDMLRGYDFFADICVLNEYARRLTAMPREQRAVHNYLLQQNDVQDFMDALRMTQRLETIPVIHALHAAELGRYVIEHHAMQELEKCPEKLRSYLDAEKIGKLYAAEHDGIFTGGIYCEPNGYKPPDTVEVPVPPEGIIRVLAETSDQTHAEWITLPTDRIDIEGLRILKSETAFPWLTLSETDSMTRLNAFAKQVAALDHGEFLCMKALAVKELATHLSEYESLLNQIGDYAFDASVIGYSGYAKSFLVRSLPPELDVSAVISSDLTELGSELLNQQHGSMTSYGVLSGEGMELYPVYNADAIEKLEVTLEGGQSL